MAIYNAAETPQLYSGAQRMTLSIRAICLRRRVHSGRESGMEILVVERQVGNFIDLEVEAVAGQRCDDSCNLQVDPSGAQACYKNGYA